MEYKRDGQWLTATVGQQWDGRKVGDLLTDWRIGKIRSYWLAGRILADDRPARAETRLAEGMRLSIAAFEPSPLDFAAGPQPAPCAYIDDIMAVFVKPRGMIIYPADKAGQGTLANMVAAYYVAHGIQAAVRPIQRLDRETGGLVIFALSPFFQPLLDDMLANRLIHRHYYALVEGVLTKDGLIDAPIGRDRHDAHRQRVSPTGQPAVTRYHVLERRGSRTLVDCQLQTGRTHQIRVHMAHIGHPVVNDPLYGHGQGVMALQAYMMAMTHPLTGQPLTVEIPIDF